MAYLGQTVLPFDPLRSAAPTSDADRFSGNGSTTTFTLSRPVTFPTDLEVFVENIQQEPINSYSVVGTSLVFTEAPPSGTNNVYVVYRNYQSGAQITLPDGSVTYNKLANNIRLFTTDNYTSNAGVSTFTMSEQPADANTVLVTIDGIVQRATEHYSVSGRTITFTSTPAANSLISIRHLGFRTTTTVTAISPGANLSNPIVVNGMSITGNTTLSSGSLVLSPGTAGQPALSFAGNTSTGIFFPATSTIAFSEGGVEAMRIDASGNLLLNTTTNNNSAKIKIATAARTGTFFDLNATGGESWIVDSNNTTGSTDVLGIYALGATGLYLRDDGNVGIGTNAPTYKIQAHGTTPAYFGNGTDDGTRIGYASALPSNSVNCFVGWVPDTVGGINGDLALCPRTSAGGKILFFTGTTTPTERARITSGGFSKFSVAGTYADAARFHEMRTNQSDYAAVFSCTASSSPYGINVNYTAAAPNNTTSTFLECVDSVAARATIRSNGGIANYQANNVNLSDRREKTNFAPAKNYLDVICAIPVQTFNYIDQNVEDDPGLTLGVVAQDVQSVAPEMVMESNWGTEEEPKMRLSIYQTDLQYALMKCIQELKAELDATKAEIAALKGAA